MANNSNVFMAKKQFDRAEKIEKGDVLNISFELSKLLKD